MSLLTWYLLGVFLSLISFPGFFLGINGSYGKICVDDVFMFLVFTSLPVVNHVYSIVNFYFIFEHLYKTRMKSWVDKFLSRMLSFASIVVYERKPRHGKPD